MKTIVFLSITSIAIFLSSCGAEEIVINNTDTGWTIIASTSENPSKLSVVHQPDNVVKTADAFSAANSEQLASRVTKIVQFDTALYLLMPQVQRIEVVSRNSFKRIATINTTPHSVVDMCFANATTAYSANSDSTVSIIDVTVYRLLNNRDIAISSEASAIAALGNQICVCCPTSNEINIIDSPTNILTRKISTPAAPTFVGADVTNGTFVVACVGNGKSSGNTMPPSPAHVISYSVLTKSLGADIILSESGIAAEDVLARCLFVKDGGFCYLGLNSTLTLIDTRNNVVIGALAQGEFSTFAYSARRNEISFFDLSNTSQSSCLLVDLRNSTIKSTTKLSIGLTSALTP